MVLGEALYRMAGRLTRPLDRRRKWEALRQLETETRYRMAETLARQGGTTRDRVIERWLDRVAGVALAIFPWRLVLRIVGMVAASTVRSLEQLEHEGPERDRPLLESLTVHERAQCEFVRRELAGDGDRSLEPVLAILNG